MHRTNSVPHKMFAILLLSLMLGEPAATVVCAADNGAASPPSQGSPLNITVPIGGTKRLQLRSKKAIVQAVNPKEGILLVSAMPGDPTSVMLTGREPGITTVTLTGEDKVPETYKVLVQIDVDFLKDVLQRAVPTANVQLIPAGGNSMIIAGTVAHTEDVDLIMKAASGFVPAPINAMRVGGVMQVQLDVILAFVNRSELRGLGFDFLNAGQQHTITSGPGGLLQNPFQQSPILNIPQVASPIVNGVTNPPTMFMGLYNNTQAFNGLLQALHEERLTKVLSEPRATTTSGRPATIVSGGDQPVPNGGGLGGVSFGFQRFGTTLTFLPVVLGNGKIFLQVDPEVSFIDPAISTPVPNTAGFIFGRTLQRITTSVEMEDGQTLVIGGLIESRTVATIRKIPCLGDLPFIGVAFSSKSYSDEEKELVVMVTPHLVDPMSCDQLPRMLPGQETRKPDDFELFLEGIIEAPRGPREVFPRSSPAHYVPAWKNDPTGGLYPCAGECGNGKCGKSGCGNGKCATCPCAPPDTNLHGYPGMQPAVMGQPTAPPPVAPAARQSAPANAGANLLPQADPAEVVPVPQNPALPQARESSGEF